MRLERGDAERVRVEAETQLSSTQHRLAHWPFDPGCELCKRVQQTQAAASSRRPAGFDDDTPSATFSCDFVGEELPPNLRSLRRVLVCAAPEGRVLFKAVPDLEASTHMIEFFDLAYHLLIAPALTAPGAKWLFRFDKTRSILSARVSQW